MPSCSNITFKLPDGSTIEGNNTIVKDLAKLMDIDEVTASTLIDNIVKLEDNTPGSFGAWYKSQQTAYGNLNPNLNEDGMLEASAIYRYMKSLELRADNNDIFIAFPNLIVDQDIAEPVLEATAIGIFKRMFIDMNMDFNQIIHQLANKGKLPNEFLTQEIQVLVKNYKNRDNVSDNELGQLVKWMKNSEAEGKTALANTLKKFIENLINNPEYYELALYKYLQKLSIASNITLEEPNVSTADVETDIEIDNEQVDQFEESDDTSLDESTDFIAKDNAQYNQKLEINHRAKARLSVFLFANTITDYDVTVKPESMDKENLTMSDYDISVAINPDNMMPKVVDGKKVMRTLHNFLADGIPSIDYLRQRIEQKKAELFKNPSTAHDGVILHILGRRLNAYQSIDEIAAANRAFQDGKYKTLLDTKEGENLLLQEKSRTELVQQFTKTSMQYFSTVFKRVGRNGMKVIRSNSNKTQLGELAGRKLQDQINNGINKLGIDKVYSIFEKLVNNNESAVNKLYDFFDLLEVQLPNLDYYTKVDLKGNAVRRVTDSAMHEIATKLFEKPGDTARSLKVSINSKEDLFNMFDYKRDNKFMGTNMRNFLNLVAQNSYYDYEVMINTSDGKRLYSIALNHHLSLTANYVNNYYRKATPQVANEILAEEFANVGQFHEEAPSIYLQELQENQNYLKVGIDITAVNDSGFQQTSQDTRKLGIADRFLQVFAGVVQGSTPIIQAADRPVHMNTYVADANGNLINTFTDDKQELKARLINAVRYELLVSRQYYNEGVGKNLKAFDEHMQDFRMFKGLAKELGMSMEELTEIPLAPLDPGVESTVFLNKASLNNKVSAFIDKKMKDWTNELDTYLKNEGIKLNTEFTFGYDLETLTINQMLGHFEQVRLFFGDLAVFKDSNEMFKRVATANSSKEIQRVDAGMNEVIAILFDLDSFENDSISDTINDVPNKDVYENWLDFSEDQIIAGNHVSVVFQDPVSEISRDNPDFKQDMYNSFVTYLENLGVSNAKKKAQEWVDGYSGNEHADSAAIISIDAYRRIMNRNGNWTPYHDKLYNKILNNEPITKQDLRKARITPLKLQYSGFYKSGQNRENGFYANRKFAAFPAIPGLIDEDSALQEVVETMQANRIEFGFFASSAKVIHGPTYSFYNFKNDWEDRLYYSETDIELLTDILPAQSMGIQQNINEQEKGKVTASIQLAKNVLTNLYENGQLTQDKAFRVYIDQYENANQEIVRREAERLIKDLNIPELNSYQDFFIADFNSLVDIIKGAAKDRGYGRDVLNVIDKMYKPSDDFGGLRPVTYLEQLPIYDSVQFLLTSIFRNRVVSKKRKGEGYVQAPSVGTELNKNTTNIEASLNQRYQFYRKSADGQTWLPMQIAEPLPMDLFDYVAKNYGNGEFTQDALNKFNEAIAEDEQRFIESNGKIVTTLTNIRKRIGYRIPHQAASSTEVIHVTKFLHPAVNTQVIVPKELIKKNGSDYDVDKMNVYKPAYEVTIKNNKYNLNYPESNLESLYQRYLKEQADLGNSPVDETTFAKSINSYPYMTNNELTNSLLESEMAIVLHPSNVAQMLAPLSESALTNKEGTGYVDRILKLKGINDDPVGFDQALTPTTQLKKHRVFNGVKSNVGVAAINIGWFPIFQKGSYYINDTSTGMLNLLLEDTAGQPGKKHNLASRTTQTGELKSEIASQYANGYLDSAAKNGYPQLANMTGKNAGILFLGLHMGADPYKTLLILNQPVIDNYLKQKAEQLRLSNMGRKISNSQVMLNAVSPFLTGNKAKEAFENFSINENTTLTLEDLEQAIKDPNSANGKRVQVIVAKLYGELLDINNNLFEFSAKNSADRSNYKRKSDFEASVKSEQSVNKILFSAAEDIENEDLGFLAQLKKAKKEYLDKISNLFMHNYPGIKEATDSLKQELATSSMGFNKRALNRAINSINKQVFVFGISDIVLGSEGVDFQKVIKETMQSKNSVANRIFKIQNNPNDPLYDTPLINALTPLLNYQNKGYDVLKPDINEVSPREQAAIKRQHRDLFKGSARDKKLALDLVKLSLVQTGHESSVFNLAMILNEETIYNYTAPYAESLVGRLQDGDLLVINELSNSFVYEYIKTFSSKFNFDQRIILDAFKQVFPSADAVRYDNTLKKRVISRPALSYAIPSEPFALLYGEQLSQVPQEGIVSQHTFDQNTDSSIRSEVIEEKINKCIPKK